MFQFHLIDASQETSCDISQIDRCENNDVII